MHDAANAAPTSVRARLSDRSLLEDLAEAVASAPSVLNAQPWRLEVTDDALELHLHDRRRPALLDPDARESLISCGAALFNLRVAAESHGLPHLATLVDGPGSCVARLVLQEPLLDEEAAGLGGVDAARELFQMIPWRRTSREPFTAAPIPADVVAGLRRAARTERARLEPLAEPARSIVLDLGAEGERRLAADRRLRIDVSPWLGDSNSFGPRSVGVPSAMLGPVPGTSPAPTRDIAMGAVAEPRDTADHEDDPALFVLLTREDVRRAWLSAGQALQRVLLTATARGLGTGLLTSPLQLADLRDQVAELVAPGWAPQMIVRLGYGDMVAATPRLPVSDILS